MRILSKTLFIGAFLLSAASIAEARILLGEAKVDQQGQIVGTVLNQGAKPIKTDISGFPGTVAPNENLEYKIAAPSEGNPLQVRYTSDKGEGCLFYYETLYSSCVDKDITYVFAQPLHAREICRTTGFTGNHISVMADKK